MPFSSRRVFGAFARAGQDLPPTQPTLTPAFTTQASDMPVGSAGRRYIWIIDYVGSPDPIMEVSGYTASTITLRNQGGLAVLEIPNPVAGSYPNFQLVLRETIGDAAGEIKDTISGTLVINSAAQLTTAVINSTSLTSILYDDPNPLVPLDVSGSEPYTLAVTAGALPSGVIIRSGFVTRADLLITCVQGKADVEGAGVSVTIQVTGANGTPSTAVVFANGITVNRPPEFVGINKIPILPANTPGTLDLAPFIRAFPAITTMTASPVLSTIHANLAVSGLTITYGNLTTIAGTQSVSVTFSLASNGIGTPGTLDSVLEVSTTGTVPVGRVVASYDLSAYSATDNSVITSVPDMAQGAALPMTTTLQFSGALEGPRWDNTNKVAKFRRTAGSSIGIPIDVGLYPHAVGLALKLQDTSPSGLLEFMRGTGQFYYFNEGVAGGAAPAFVSKQESSKSGTASSHTFTYTPGATIRALVVKIIHGSTATDRVSSVTVDDGGTPVPLVRSVAAVDNAGEPGRTYIYFLGSGIPTGAVLNIVITYDSSNGTSIHHLAEGYSAAADVEVINTQKIDGGDPANPSVTLVTGGRSCLATGIIMSGHDATASIVQNGNMTHIDDNDFGTFVYMADRQTTASTSNFVFSYTATAEDAALSAITMSEVQGAGVTMAIGNNALASTTTLASALNNKHRYIFYASSATAGAFWYDGVKQTLTATNMGGRLKDIILGASSGGDYDLYKMEVWQGTLPDAEATAMDTRINTNVTPPVTPPPNPPTSVGAAAGDTVVNLTWTAAPNATSYKIERSTTGGGVGFASIATGVVDVFYQDPGRTNGVQYFYRLKSTGTGGDSATYSAEVSATPAAQTPNAPRNLRASAGDTVVVLTWDPPL